MSRELKGGTRLPGFTDENFLEKYVNKVYALFHLFSKSSILISLLVPNP